MKALRLHAAMVMVVLAMSAQQDPERILQQAIQLHQAGKAEEAIPQYRAYLKLRPDATDARSNLGAALAATGRYEQAITEYQTALKQRPGDARIHMNLALARYKLGMVGEAANEFEALHAAAPGDRQISLLLADCWLRQGLNGKVIELLAPAAERDPADLAAAYLLGTALLRDSQISRGQQMIDRILRNGDSAEARLLMGTAKLQARDFEAAIRDLQKAAELDPHLPDVYSYLGRACLGTNDPVAARAAFEKELQENPNDFESNLNLAALLRQNEDYAGARRLLDRALRVRPGDARARFQLASDNLAAGRLEEARTGLEALVRQSPRFVEAHLALATTYYRLKRQADGDRERAVAQKLTAEQRSKEQGTPQ